MTLKSALLVPLAFSAIIMSVAGTAQASNPLNISNEVSTAQTSTTLTFTFTTDNPGSTQLAYGINSTYGSMTTEADTSPRVTSHTAIIAGLQPCTVYAVQAISYDANAFKATSNSFNAGPSGFFGGAISTLGCLGNLKPLLADELFIKPGDLASNVSDTTTSHASSSIDVDTPTGLVSQNTTLQVKGFDSAGLASVIGTPTGYQVLQDTVFQLTALTDSLAPVTSFAQPLTVRLGYSSADFSTINPVSITIQQWEENSHTWSPLTGCATTSYNANSQPDPNGTIKSIACQTNHFSVFALTGKTQQAATTASPSSMPTAALISAVSSSSKPVATLPVTGVDLRNLIAALLFMIGSLSIMVRLIKISMN